MYIIIKTAVYDHGVIWVTNTLTEAKVFLEDYIKLNSNAGNDGDGHHDYKIKFCKPNTKPKLITTFIGKKFYNDNGRFSFAIYAWKSEKNPMMI